MVRQFMNNWKAFLDHSAPLFLLLSILSHCQRKNEHFSINWRNFFSFECKKICFWYTSKYYKVGVSINGIVMVVGKSLVIISLYSLPIGLTGQFGFQFQHLQRPSLKKGLLGCSNQIVVWFKYIRNQNALHWWMMNESKYFVYYSRKIFRLE